MHSFLIKLIFFTIAAPLYAENTNVKWIPLKPIHSEELTKADFNHTTIQTNTQMIQNLKTIKNLLDHVAKERIQEDQKNWYSMEPSEE